MGEKTGQFKDSLFLVDLIFITEIQNIFSIVNGVDIEWHLSITKVIVDQTIAFRLNFRLLSDSIKFNHFNLIISSIDIECDFSLIKVTLWRSNGINILIMNVKVIEIKQRR